MKVDAPMTDIRREYHEDMNGDTRYVRYTEFQDHTNHVLEAIGALTTEVSRLTTRLGKAASLPDIQGAIIEEREITKITNLKSQLTCLQEEKDKSEKAAQKRRDFWFGMFALAAATAIGSVATAVALRYLHI